MPRRSHRNNDVDVRVSNKTDNQTRINSRDNHDIASGEQNLTGSDLGIQGVSSSARISSNIGSNHADVTLDSAWNSVKNVEVRSRDAADVSLNNFVHTSVKLRGTDDSNVEITGAKRGDVRTGHGDDNISVDAQTNGSGWSNQFKIYSGHGNDTLTLDGDKGVTMFKVNTGFGNDVITMIGDDYASVKANLGRGDDRFTGGSGRDYVRAGSGDDTVSTGGGDDIVKAGHGDDVVDGGVGQDKLIGGHGNDTLLGGFGNDKLSGGHGDDYLDGGEGVDKLNGGHGDDTLVFDAADSYINGGRGDDTLVVDGDLDISSDKPRSIENVEMRDDAGDDSVDITMDDARKMSETDIVKITGDEGDVVNEFAFKSQLEDVVEGDVTFSVFEGSRGEQIWVQHGMTMGNAVVGAPVVDEISDTVLLGTKSESGSMADWGTLNDDGTVSFDKGGISGSIEASNKHGEDADVAYSVGGSGGGRKDFGIGVKGGGSDEIDLNESVTVNFDESVESARIGFDSLFGHFNDGSRQDARVSWEAYEDGELVASGEVKNDTANVDGDNSRETNFIDVEHSFDSIVFETVSPTSTINSNFNIRYIEANLAGDVTPTEDPMEMIFLDESAGYKNTLGYYTVDEEGNISNVTIGFENASLQGSGGDLIGGESSAAIDVPEGSHLEFFIVANGYSKNHGYSCMDEDGEFKFVDSNGDAANVSGDVPQLVYTDASGHTTVIKGYTYHTNNDNLNVDGADHATIELSDDGNSVVIGFEDLKGLGDADYDDSVFQVNVGNHEVNVGGIDFEGETTDPALAAVDDAFATVEDVAGFAFTTADLLENDVDAANIVSVDAATSYGGVVEYDAATGEMNYIPKADFNGLDTFTYTVVDAEGNESSATVTMNVVGVNDAPIAVDDVLTTDEDTILNFTAADILANDTDVDNGSLNVNSIDAVSANGGVVTFDAATGNISYVPAENFNGEDTISYTIDDNNGETSTATITVTVNSINDDPVAVDDAFTTDEDVALNFAAADILANDTDVDGDVLSVTSVDAASENGGIVEFDAVTGEISYVPAENFNGEDTISYSITDGNGGTSTATITVTVNSVNDGPVAIDDAFATVEDVAGFAFTAADLLANDSDLDGDVLTIQSVDAATSYGGVVEYDAATGEMNYIPKPDFSGLDTFTYTVVDAEGNESSATVTMNVAGVNDAPEAFDDVLTTDEDTILNFAAADILANDTDVDGGSLNVNSIDAVSANGGVVEFDAATGNISYVPAENFNGEDTISYTIDDNNGETSTATITVTVNPVNDGPIAIDDAFTTDEEVILNFTAGNLLANDTDLEGDALSVTSVDAASANGGVVTFDEVTGTISYEPAVDFSGEDTINYSISDGNGGTSTATVVITVNDVNNGPEAVNDEFSVNEDAILNFTATDILANDTDADGDVLTVTSVNTVSANGGVVTFDEVTGEISYTPAENFNGGDTISYSISDGNGGTSTATIVVTVNPLADAPIAENLTGNAVEDGSEIVLDASVINVDGGELFYTLSSAPDEGTVVNNNDGTFTFDVGNAFQDLDSGETRDVTFSYQVTDLSGNFSVADAVVTVAGVNDAPNANNSNFNFTEDTVAEVTANFNVTDADIEPVTVTLLNQLDPQTEGTVVNNDNGTFTFTPAAAAFDHLNAGEEVTFSVSYSATDGDLNDVADLTFTVVGTNDPTVVEEIIIDDVVDDGEPIIIDIIGTVTDADGNDTVTVTVPNPPAPEEGELVDNGDGTFTFIPAPELDALDDGETQEITFEYEVTDEEGNVVTETVTIIVTGTNDAPVAENVTITTPEDDSVNAVFSATDVDTNDVLTYSLVTTPNPATEGVVAIGANGEFSFTPAAALDGLAEGETQVVTFIYSASDGDASENAGVTVTIVGTNDKPVVDDITINHLENDAAQTVDILPFLSDVDSDDDASTLTYSVATSTKGSLTDLGGGQLEFDTLSDFDHLGEGDIENMEVVLTVQDSHGAVTTKNIVIRVTGENDAPVAEAVSATVSEDGSMNMFLPVSDVDGDSLSISFADAPDDSVMEMDVTGTLLTVTPGVGLQYLAEGETAEFNVTYNVFDGVETSQNVITITVEGHNDAPTIQNIEETMLEDDPSITAAFSGTDFEGDSIIYLVQTPPLDADGFVTINNLDGTFTFTPNAGLDSLGEGDTKVISFTYTATDGVDTSSIKTVQITVQGQNDAPVLADITETIGEDDGTQVFSLGVTDVDNSMAELSFTLDTAPSDATVVLNADGTFSFTPGAGLQALNTGETADVQFTYTVSDGVASVTKTATITVTGSDDDPVANELFFESPFHTIERFDFSFDVDEAFSSLTGSETITFTDENGDPAPTWLTYNSSEGRILANVPANSYGEYALQIHINTGSEVIIQDFTLYVNRELESLDTTAIINGSNDNVVTGTAASEYISVNDGDDVVNAGAGNDVIFGGDGNDILNGEEGNDTFLLTGISSTDGTDTIFGGEGHDTIVFHESNNKTFNIDGDYSVATNSIEEFKSSGARVNIINGSGDDVMDFSDIILDGDFRIFGGNGNDTVTGSVGDDYLNGSGGNDTIIGGFGDDDIYGSSGDDILYGGEGNDYFDGSSGANSIYGEAGNDTIRYSASDVIVDGGLGGFDTLSLRSNLDLDFGAIATDYSNLEAIDLDYSSRANDIHLNLNDVLDMADNTLDTLYVLGDNGDTVTTDGDFDVAVRIETVDTNGDGSNDTTFQVYSSTLQSDIFIGIEIGVGISLDGTEV